MRLADKSAIVTGGASGIGKAIARAFAVEGADVAILDIDLEGAEKVASGIAERGRKACAIRCDVGYADQVEAAFKQADEALGKVDILVNNTGIIRFSQIVDMAEDEWDLILRTNLKSVFLCSQQAARRREKEIAALSRSLCARMSHLSWISRSLESQQEPTVFTHHATARF